MSTRSKKRQSISSRDISGKPGNNSTTLQQMDPKAIPLRRALRIMNCIARHCLQFKRRSHTNWKSLKVLIPLMTGKILPDRANQNMNGKNAGSQILLFLIGDLDSWTLFFRNTERARQPTDLRLNDRNFVRTQQKHFEALSNLGLYFKPTKSSTF